METTPRRTPDGFGFTGSELTDLVLVNYNLQCNSLAAFRPEEKRAPAETENARQALASPKFRRAAEILTQPHFRLTTVKGGGALAAETFTVYAQVNASGMELAALLKPEKAVIVMYFEDAELFIDWWTGTLASKARAPSVNYLVPPLPTEEFVFILHTIDAFRRVYMESMMLYTHAREFSMSEKDFVASFSVSLGSGDIRWLMPALFSLTPGLAGAVLDIQPGLVETAEALRFIKYEKGDEPGNGRLRFQDPALAMGYEFASFWQFGLGLQAEVLVENAIKPMAWEFLAPTNFANHLFTVKTGDMGIRYFRHHQMTYGGYRKHVSGLLGMLASNYRASPPVMESAVPNAAPAIRQQMAAAPIPAAPMPAQKAAFCSNCGSKLMEKAAFCANCGYRVS